MYFKKIYNINFVSASYKWNIFGSIRKTIHFHAVLTEFFHSFICYMKQKTITLPIRRENTIHRYYYDIKCLWLPIFEFLLQCLLCRLSWNRILQYSATLIMVCHGVLVCGNSVIKRPLYRCRIVFSDYSPKPF